MAWSEACHLPTEVCDSNELAQAYRQGLKVGSSATLVAICVGTLLGLALRVIA